jgi:2-dehydropantoate 2-reductase
MLSGSEEAPLRIAVIGAGGVGGYYGGALARRGHEVSLLARGEHLAALRSRGLEVREPDGPFTVAVRASERPEDLLPADLAIVAVKSYSVAEVSPAVRLLGENGAIVLPLLNGVEAFESLAEGGVPKNSMLAGLTVISAARAAPGVIERKSDFRSVVLGEREGGGSPRAERIAAAFAETGTETRVSEKIVVDLWQKFLFLSTIAAACGLARAPIGAVRQAPLGLLLLQRAFRETAAVARARGVDLPAGVEEGSLERIQGLAGHLKPSLLLDLENGRPTELDVLSGAISRFGREFQVPTPIHDTVVAALSAASSRPDP